MKTSTKKVSKLIEGRRLKHSVFLNLDKNQDYYIFGKKAIKLSKVHRKIFNEFRIRGATNDLCPFTEKELRKFKECLNVALSENLFFTPLKYKSRALKKNVDYNACCEVISSALEMWKPIAHSHSFFNLIQKKPIAFAMYLLEIVTFTFSVEDYMKPAIRSSPKKLKKILQNWLNEESEHYKPMLEGLNITLFDFMNHDMNEGTLAIVSYLKYLSSSRPLSLAICLSLFESDIKKKKIYKDFYNRHINKIEYDPAPLYKHHFEDIKMNHIEKWKDAIPLQGLSAGELSCIVSDLHSTKHMIILWYDAMYRSFSKVNYVSRHKIKPRQLIKPKPIIGSV